MKIIFFGTSNVALPILEALSKQNEILAVVTQPDSKVGRKQEIKESPVSVLANEMKLRVLKPQKVRGNKAFLEELSALGAELFVVVSYGQILPEEVINLPKYKTINVHFSVLPKYRGASPIQYALLNGEEYTGASVFILDEQVDHGPLLGTEILKIDGDDNYLTLSQKLAYKSAAIINGIIQDYVSGKIVPQPQDDLAATFSKIISKTDGQINWQKTASEIYNQFRAFYPWPGVWTKWNGKIVKVTDADPNTANYIRMTRTGTETPGTVFEGGIVACGQGTFIQIKTLQLEGKKETKITDFLNGNSGFIGGSLSGL